MCPRWSDCNCAILLRGAVPKQKRTIATPREARDSNEGSIILFIYFVLCTSFLYSLFIDWTINFQNSKGILLVIYIMFIWVFAIRGKWMCPACLIRVKRCLKSASHVRYTQTHHHRADHLLAQKDYLRIERDYLQLWGNFCRIVSLFLITRLTLNQSMNKNTWMPYIIFYHRTARCTLLLL